MAALAKSIIYFGEPAVVVCDGKCHKAWGINNRPCVELNPNDPDDVAYLADDELGIAPVDPGTYEGGMGKPQETSQRLNKWCVRECERSKTGKPNTLIVAHSFEARLYNKKQS